jgi:hypothetical protein
MLRLGTARKSLIIISSVLALFVILSAFLVFFQDNFENKTISFPQIKTPESKFKSIENSLSKVIPFETALEPWENEENLPEVPSNLLHVEGIITDLKTECKPVAKGYSKEEAEALFDPHSEFPDCLQQTPKTVKTEKNLLKKTCEEMEFILGKPPADERFGRIPYDLSWTLAKSDVDTKDREFAFIKCGEKREAVVLFKKNNQAQFRAGRITEFNKKQMKLEKDPKPLTVFMLIFDSLSRSHMYRNFPKTMKLLNESIGLGEYKEKFVMYDFLLNHAHGENTIPNMVPYLFGYGFPYYKLKIGNHSHLNIDDTSFFVDIQKYSIWKQFENMGFVTMFGFDIIWDFLVPAVGRVIKTDHVFTNFWKAASKVFGTDNYINEHSCFGSFNSHRYMFEYIEKFLKEYQGFNRFGYSHVTTAHEKSGTIIRTADQDLFLFMSDVLKFYNENDEDFFFILAGDHGKHVSETDFVKPGFIENMLPGQIVISNKDLIHKLKAEKILTHNTQKLISRSDWHLTLNHLSLIPYGSLQKDSRLYQNWKKASETDHIVSLLLEKVPDSRTCQDVNIEDYFCVCLPYKELDEKDYEKNEILSKVAHFSIQSINKSQRNNLCMQFSFQSVVYAAVREIQSDYQLYRVRVNIVESLDVVLEIFAAVYPESVSDKYRKNDPSLHFQTFNYKENQGKMEIQLLKMVRIDEYVGFNEEFAVAIHEKPSFCIPKRPYELSSADFNDVQLTLVLDKLKSQLVIRMAPFDQSCFDVCKDFDQICQTWGIELFSNEEILFSSWDDEESIIVYSGDTEISISQYNYMHDYGDDLSITNTTIYYPIDNLSCHSHSSSHSLLCPCKK